jgi:hypothetical protein
VLNTSRFLRSEARAVSADVPAAAPAAAAQVPGRVQRRF